jgi:hypothetical protein
VLPAKLIFRVTVETVILHLCFFPERQQRHHVSKVIICAHMLCCSGSFTGLSNLCVLSYVGQVLRPHTSPGPGS